ncbi:MAG: acetylxylan esterase [Dysgonamonadaceae bacterium]|nr:acetylxylan esterase [Dysgonamonadaceae bacterium]
MCKIKNSLFAMLLMIIFSGIANAQWLSSDIYDQPLKEVLDQIEERYNVQLIYEERHVVDRIVLRAPWRLFIEVEPTLDNVLRPLDMRWSKVRDGVYEIKRWDYFRKPFEEGEKHVKALLEAYPDLASWEIRKAELRAHMMEEKGLVGLKKGSLNPIVSPVRRFDGYTVQNIALEILPGVWVSGSLYKPTRYRGRIPVFLSPHGHFSAGSSGSDDDHGRYRPDQQYRCAMLARMGVAVFSYDKFGNWGDSRLAFNAQVHRSDLGLSMQTWQSIRILDYLSEQPWADMTRVGVTGASGGGSQVMFIAALDDRITLSVPVVMMASHFFGGCPCESGLPIHFPKNGLPSNNAEIAAMAAPMPQLLISVGGDWTRTTPEIEYPYIKQIYGYFGKADNLENVHLTNEGHDYGISKRVALYDFVARRFGLNATSAQNRDGVWDESKVTIETADALKVFPDGQLPAHAIRGEQALRELLEKHRE